MEIKDHSLKIHLTDCGDITISFGTYGTYNIHRLSLGTPGYTALRKFCQDIQDKNQPKTGWHGRHDDRAFNYYVEGIQKGCIQGHSNGWIWVCGPSTGWFKDKADAVSAVQFLATLPKGGADD